MCLFTHFAAGALVGGATQNVGLAVVAGLASHAVLDILPHYDFPDWRVELAGGVLALLVFLALPFWTWPALVGGLAGMLPDLENLFQKLGRMKRSSFIFPTHTGRIPHGRTTGPGTLVWQFLIAAVCLAGLGWISPSSARGQTGTSQDIPRADDSQLAADVAIMGHPQVSLPVTEAGLTQLRVNFPVRLAPSDWRTVVATKVQWEVPGGEAWDDEGNPFTLPAVHRVNLAVPCLNTPVWRVADLRWWREPTQDVDPAALVQVSGPGICRDVPLVTVSIFPQGVDGGILAGVTLVLDHPPAGECLNFWQAGLDKNGVSPEPEDLAPASVANPQIYQTLRLGARSIKSRAAKARQTSTHPFSRTNNWLRLEVDMTGVYHLDGYELDLLGVPIEDVDPQKLRLFKGGGLPLVPEPLAADVLDSLYLDRTGLNEVAILVRDGGNEWDSTDDFMFYGFGGDAWLDRLDATGAPLDHFEHPYENHGVYWLTWEDYSTPSPFPTAPRRIPTVAAPALGSTVEDVHQGRLHVEQSNIDWIGLLADNWAWDVAVFDSKFLPFQLPDPVPGRPTQFVVDVRTAVKRRSSLSTPNLATVWLNNDTAHSASSTWLNTNQADSLRIRIVGTSDAAISGTNVLTLRNDNEPFGNQTKLALALDSFDILYWTPLTKQTDQLPVIHWGHQVNTPGDEVDLTITLAGQNVPVVWDVTRPDSAVVFTGTHTSGAEELLTLGLVRDPDTSRHFQIFEDADLLTPQTSSVYDYQPRDLRSSMIPVDYLVIFDPLFRSGAIMLAGLRSRDLPGYDNPQAGYINEEDIYDNFSGGQKDPYALRDFLHWLYDHPDGPGRLQYACWMGDASRDYRDYLDHDPSTQLYDFLPTVIRDYYPALPRSGYSTEPYASDDELVSFDILEPGVPLDIPDLISGRLTVVSSNEAIDTVQRIVAYVDEPELGLWRNRVVLVADDMETPSGPESGQHMRQSENCANSYLPQTLDLEKIYLVDYEKPPGSSNKPGARLEAKRQLNLGTSIFHYVGHGSNAALADEQVLLIEDIYSLDNGARRGLFTAFSCDVGIYESPVTQSMAEIFISQAAGGTMTAICASQVSWTSYNDQLAYAFYRDLYPNREVTQSISAGRALWGAKVYIGEHPLWGSSLAFMQNAQRYLLFGDPALRLPNPNTGVVFASASPDSLRGGLKETVVVDMNGSGILPGTSVTYDLRVEESRQLKSATQANFTVYYWLSGAAVFRGTGQVLDQMLHIPFKVPTQLRYGDSGRVRVLIDTPFGAWAGSDSLPVVIADIGEVDDVEGPAIALAFEDDRYRVRAGTQLQAGIADTSGISILGTNPSNSVLLEFDSSGFMTDVSEAFNFEPGSYTTGQVSVPLPGDLPLGNHKATLLASDVLGNVGSDTLSFLLVAESFSGIEDVTVYPNPTPGPCRLIFEISDPMSVDWDIFTLAGRNIKHMTENFPSSGPKIMAWDGLDHYGDEIANGVYLYVLSGRPNTDDSRDVRQTGKLVIMK